MAKSPTQPPQNPIEIMLKKEGTEADGLHSNRLRHETSSPAILPNKLMFFRPCPRSHPILLLFETINFRTNHKWANRNLPPHACFSATKTANTTHAVMCHGVPVRRSSWIGGFNALWGPFLFAPSSSSTSCDTSKSGHLIGLMFDFVRK